MRGVSFGMQPKYLFFLFLCVCVCVSVCYRHERGVRASEWLSEMGGMGCETHASALRHALGAAEEMFRRATAWRN